MEILGKVGAVHHAFSKDEEITLGPFSKALDELSLGHVCTGLTWKPSLLVNGDFPPVGFGFGQRGGSITKVFYEVGIKGHLNDAKIFNGIMISVVEMASPAKFRVQRFPILAKLTVFFGVGDVCAVSAEEVDINGAHAFMIAVLLTHRAIGAALSKCKAIGIAGDKYPHEQKWKIPVKKFLMFAKSHSILSTNPHSRAS